MGLGIPVTSHFLVSEERSPLLLRITRLTWKIQTTLVDTLAIRAYKTECLFEGLEFGTFNLLGTAGRFRILVGIVDSCGITLGFKELDAQAVFPLSTGEG